MILREILTLCRLVMVSHYLIYSYVFVSKIQDDFHESAARHSLKSACIAVAHQSSLKLTYFLLRLCSLPIQQTIHWRAIEVS